MLIFQFNQCANLLGAEEGSTSIENCMLLLHSEAFTPRLIWNREMRGKVVDYVDNRANELAVSNFLNDDSDDSDVMPSLPWYATHPRITSLATSFAV